MVAADALPADVADRFNGLQTPIKPDREPAAAPDEWRTLPPVRSRAAGKERARLEALRPALATSPGTAERAAAITAAAAAGGVSKNTVRRWIARHERRGIVGLARKRRADAGTRRAFAWMALDQRLRAAGRTDQEIGELAERVRRHVRGLLASTSASSALVAQACIGFVAQ